MLHSTLLGLSPEPVLLQLAQQAATETLLYAAVLRRFRPNYPQQVYDIILSHLGKDQRNSAVDVATGSGQAAVQLAQHFKQVQARTTPSLQ